MSAHTSAWRGRRVLVTGSTGLLGAAVTRELLAHGAIVAAVVRDRGSRVEFVNELASKQFHIVHGRVEDALRLHTAMAVHEVSAVFHIASSDPFGNDRTTSAVLRATTLYQHWIPVVMARPSGHLCLASPEEDSHPVPLGIARFGELFGGGDRKMFRVVPRTIAALISGDGAPASDTNDSPRDFVYVRDAARACLALAEAVGGESTSLDFTFRSGWELDDREMVECVSDVFRGKPPVSCPEPPVNPLGWQVQTPFATAIGETIAWYREFLHTRYFGTRPTDTRKAA
jgi:CDP-glucose 4,6-dehydratase